MRILVLGSGLMGPASAYNAMTDPDVTKVTLCDLDRRQLDAAHAKLSGLKGSQKLTTVRLDLGDSPLIIIRYDNAASSRADAAQCAAFSCSQSFHLHLKDRSLSFISH